MNTVQEIYQAELRKVLRARLRGTMFPTDNVLYFPNNIDVRICPKNGMTTIKWALLYVLRLDYDASSAASVEDKFEAQLCGTKGWRVREIKEHGYQPDLPFRQESLRVAISRDPIERFLSACEYIKTEYTKSSNMLTSSGTLDKESLEALGKMSDLDDLPDNLDDIIDGVWSGDIHNSHFYTQTHFYGNRGQYDEIFQMQDFAEFLEWLRKKTGSNRKIDKIHSNSTSGLWFGSKNDLTEDQKKRIMRIYAEDYDYGWTEDEPL